MQDDHNLLTNRRIDYDLIRIVLTILVVIGHAAFYNIVTPFGSIHYSDMMAEAGIADTVYHLGITKISDLIYKFHMQAYFALSGAVYSCQMKTGKVKPYGMYLRGKIKRLLLPTVIVWFLWNVPIKLLSRYYKGIPVYKIFLQFLFPRRCYLWFVEALFLCMILLPFVLKMNRRKQCAVVMALYVMGFVIKMRVEDYILLGNPMYYFLWIWIGCNIENTFDYLLSGKNGKKLAALMCTGILSFPLTRTVGGGLE